ncbi:MAG: hypothetical protein ABJZ55_10975 [Fuerstiella sp.]
MTDLLTPTDYGRNVPKNARSTGAVELFFPLSQLLKQFTGQFLFESLAHLKKGKPIPDETQELEKQDVSSDLVEFREISGCPLPPDLKWDGTQRGLTKLLHLIDDLKNNDGSWRESLTAYLPEIDEFESRLRKRITVAIEAFHAGFGVAAALKIVGFVEAKVRNDQTIREQKGLPSFEGLLRPLSQPERRVRTIAKKPNLAIRAVGKVNDRISVGRLYPARQRSQIASLVKAGSQLQAARFHALLQPVLSDVAIRMLGDGHSIGWLHDIEEELENGQTGLSALEDALETPEQDPPPSSVARLPLVDGLDTELDRNTGHTLLEEFHLRARSVRRTPQRLAQHLHKNGVTIDGTRIHPHQWSEIPTQTLSRALLTVTEKFLGCHDISKPLRPEDPKTAADAISQLHLLHPLLRPRLQVMLRVVVERSGPYAEFDQMQGEHTNIQSYLYCDPNHRKPLIDMLSRQTVNIAEASRAEKYATGHPYSMLLLQHQICASLCTMPAVHRWSQLNNRMIRNGQVQPLEKRFRYPEIRLLKQRVRDDDDNRKLFEAAKAAGAVVQIGSTNHWTVTQPDLRLSELFAPSNWIPKLLSASQILLLVRNDPDFRAFLIAQFLSVSNLNIELERFREEHDARAVAQELTKWGVLRSDAERYSVNTTFDSFPKRAPREIVKRRPGKIVGLSEDVFLSAMATHDLLYTILFFAVTDAWQLNEIPTRQVPDSVKDFAITL